MLVFVVNLCRARCRSALWRLYKLTALFPLPQLLAFFLYPFSPHLVYPPSSRVQIPYFPGPDFDDPDHHQGSLSLLTGRLIPSFPGPHVVPDSIITNTTLCARRQSPTVMSTIPGPGLDSVFPAPILNLKLFFFFFFFFLLLSPRSSPAASTTAEASATAGGTAAAAAAAADAGKAKGDEDKKATKAKAADKKAAEATAGAETAASTKDKEVR